jgi:hypothetical protein
MKLVDSDCSILCSKCAKTHLRTFVTLKNFPGGYTPGPPLKREGGERRERGRERGMKRRTGKGREKGGEEGDGEGTGMGREGKEGRREETGTTSFRTLPPPLATKYKKVENTQWQLRNICEDISISVPLPKTWDT